MAKKKKVVGQIVNRRARYDYELSKELVCGIQLNGAETKNLRLGHGNLRGAYVTIKNDELYLINATINGTNSVPITETDTTRPRKLLASKKEIFALEEAKQNGRTIVPLSLLTKGRYIKLKIAIGKGKKNYDKRESIKKRDIKRQIKNDLK